MFEIIMQLLSFIVSNSKLVLYLVSKWHYSYFFFLFLFQVMMIHNFTCSLISLYSLSGFLYGLTLSESTFELRQAPYLQPYFRLYWITKILELLDTVFMILRHRQRQISFLHVYHHSSMLLLADACYHLYPWPAMATYLATNSFVHVILYMYYCLTASFPNKSFSWRKYITQLQILQFFVLFVHAAHGYLNHGFCVYGLFYGVTMTSLFANFYYKSYVKCSKGKPEKYYKW